MVTKKAPTGLLAKMAKFVGAPLGGGVDDGDSQQSSVQSGNSELERQALQTRIEGKRRDDQIRRMEFNHLRKLRGHDNLALGAIPRATGYEDSSGYAEALPSSAKRESTVSKINAIEAHLADHWAQRRKAEMGSGRVTSAPPTAPSPKAQVKRPPPPTEVVANAPPLPQSGSESLDSDLDLDFTNYTAPSPEEAPAIPTPVFKESGNSRFTDSRIETVELGQDLDNPGLQDAAIRFADGDSEGAEAVLLAAMQDPAALAEVAEDCAVALLDLYRATDQAASFDVIAIEFAQRFGRSAPEWYSVPTLLELQRNVVAHPRETANVSEWICPAVLDAQAVEQLRGAQSQSVERHVHWEQLAVVEHSALAPLTALFTHWAAKPLALSWRYSDVLNTILERATPTGDANVDAAWWLCRLEALRIQGEHEAFEAVALDYCVTYEVSPPSWVEADCTFTVAREPDDGPDSIPGPDSVYSTFGDSLAQEVLELGGEILGDAHEPMNKLAQRLHPGEDMIVSCTRLIRVDFAAAGSLLNWLSERGGRHGAVEFVNVPRLVAAFFAVMGITQQAGVVARTR